jgi:phosphoribosylamine--glycine ligase
LLLKTSYVLKADGLAAGKGVLIIHDLAEAKKNYEHVSSPEIWRSQY